MTPRTCRRTRPPAAPSPTSARSTCPRTRCARCGTCAPPGPSSPCDTGPGLRISTSDQGDGAGDPRALPGLGVPPDGAADGAEPVGHVDVAVALAGDAGLEAGAVIDDREQQATG